MYGDGHWFIMDLKVGWPNPLRDGPQSMALVDRFSEAPELLLGNADTAKSWSPSFSLALRGTETVSQFKDRQH